MMIKRPDILTKNTVKLGMGIFLYTTIVTALIASAYVGQGWSVIASMSFLFLVVGVMGVDIFIKRSTIKSLTLKLDEMTLRQDQLEQSVYDTLQGTSLPETPSRKTTETSQMAAFSANTHQSKEITPEELSDALVEDVIDTAMTSKDIEVFSQPVVKLPQRKAVLFELYARLPAGEGRVLTASQYLERVRANDQGPAIDKILLDKAVQVLRRNYKLGKALPYILNIEGTSFANAEFMNDLLSFLSSNRHLARFIVLETSQSVINELDPKVIDILKALGKLGCHLSMDHVETPNIDRAFLRSIGLKYLKLSAAKLKTFTESENGVQVMRRILQQLEKDGIQIIAERIEDEASLLELLDLELNLGQGFVFAKPERLNVTQGNLRAA